MTPARTYNSQIKDVRRWISDCIKLNVSSQLPVETIYHHYLLYIREHTGTLGVKPKIFSKELRLFFEKETVNHKVRFFYKEKPLVEGLEIKQP